MTKKKPPHLKKKTGRPTKLTAETIKRLEDAYAMDCTDIEACLYADISQTALYRFQDKNPDFVQRKKRLKNKPFLIARNTLLKGIKANPDLALKYMERKKKDEFSLRTEHTGADGKEIILKSNIPEIEDK